MNMNRQSMVTWGTVIILLITWEFVGHMKLVGGGTLPALSTTLIRLIRESSDYWPHIQATLKTASSGFFFGNILALFMATVFCLWPITERLFRGVNIAIFTVPPIAIVPVLVIALDGNVARITLATLLVYFPTMSAALAGMQTADSGAVDLIRVYGGNKFKIMRLLRVRAALPQILSGFQIAAPAAMLGAILAEFGSGARWGLGTFLLGSLGRAEPDRLWGIGLTATAISGLGYVLAAVVANRITGQNLTADLSVEPVTRKRSGGRLTNLLMLLATICLPFLLWHVLILLSGLSPIIAKSPENIIDYMFFARTAASAQDRLLAALIQTIPITLVGMFIGLLFAFGLALLSFIAPFLMRALLPFALITQTMPLVALTPLAVLLFGRGIAVTLVITISVTFFAAFVILARGFTLIPKGAFDLVDAYGATSLQKVKFIAVPASRTWLLVAARLALPKALLGVMIAEWLATGKGLGNLLNQSRGYLDYGMIWTVAVVSIILSVLLYQFVALIEWTVDR
jgi:sulfonate transport system permease protein